MRLCFVFSVIGSFYFVAGISDAEKRQVDCDFEENLCGWTGKKTPAIQRGVICGLHVWSRNKYSPHWRDACEHTDFYRNHVPWQRHQMKSIHGDMVLRSEFSYGIRYEGVTHVSDFLSVSLSPSFKMWCLQYRLNITGYAVLAVAHTSTKHDFKDLTVVGLHGRLGNWANSGLNPPKRGRVNLPIRKKYKIVFRAIYQKGRWGGSVVIDNVKLSQGQCLDVCTTEEFRCKDAFCIDSSKVCDYVIDCNDGSDEENCDFLEDNDIPLQSCEVTDGLKLSRDCRSPAITKSVQTSNNKHYCYIKLKNGTACSTVHALSENCSEANTGKCVLQCPDKCSCREYHFTCWTPFVPEVARSLVVSGVKFPRNEFVIDIFKYLVNLKLENCGLNTFNIKTATVKLQTVDLNRNNIRFIDGNDIEKLSIFIINQNPITSTEWIKETIWIRIIQMQNTTISPQILDLRNHKFDVDLSYNKLNGTRIMADKWDAEVILRYCSIYTLWNSDINCHTVDLRSNFLQTFSVSEKVKILFLQDNELKEFIGFNDEPRSATLLDLYLQNNMIESLEMRDLRHFNSLVNLNLKGNRISTIEDDVFSFQESLNNLDLSNNKIRHISQNGLSSLSSLQYLSLQGNLLTRLNSTLFSSLTELLSLDLSSNSIHIIDKNAFHGLSSLKNLSMKNNNFLVKKSMFDGLSVLYFLHVDDYTICCARPVTVFKEHCITSTNEVSSCDQLIDVPVLGVCIWYMALLAVFGNISVLAYRIIIWRTTPSKTQAIFTINLSVADFLMGVYLYILAITNIIYTGEYGLADHDWRTGYICMFSGILATLSSEASAILLFFISVDRVLAIKSGLTGRKLNKSQCIIFSFLSWVISLIVAVVPVLEIKYFKSFYSSSGICISLPLSVIRRPGWEYSMAVFVGFNFILFLGILVCQILIFVEVLRVGKNMKSTQSKQREITVAKTLFSVVITDMMCWIPIGIIGLLTFFRVNVTSQIYAWIVVVILPLNSALNPLLYTLVIILRARKPEKKCEIKEK